MLTSHLLFNVLVSVFFSCILFKFYLLSFIKTITDDSDLSPSLRYLSRNKGYLATLDLVPAN